MRDTNMSVYDNMTELEELRQKHVLGLGLSVVGIFVMMFGHVSIFRSGGLSLVGFMVGIAMMLGGVFLTRKINKQFKAVYKQTFVEKPLQKNFGSVVYLWDMGFTREKVHAIGLVRMGNRFQSEDYISAIYENVKFEISDVTVKHHTSSGKHSRTVTYFKGRMMIFDFPEKFVTSLRIYSSNFQYRGDATLFTYNTAQKVSMEDVEFNQLFDVYSDNSLDAFYVLTPHFMNKLKDLLRRYGNLAIHVAGNQMVFAFNERQSNAFDASSMTKKISYPEEMAKIQRDIDDIKDIIGTIDNVESDW